VSYSIDTNLLVYATDASSAHHAGARAFLETALGTPEPCYLTWSVLMAWQRLVTSRVIMGDPLEPAAALGALQSLTAQPQVRCIAERDGFLQDYARLTQDLSVRGPLVPDAQLAVTLHQHGIRTLYTNDRDFLRFDFLDVRLPLAGQRSTD